ncbi:uncharacterized protein ARMOST_21132 [Armillaria ostoyae]|uniref:Ribonuclease H1 N-terminal domain-containing protein n=1 Tax=Armillaria ostoyae TaxID=47428 RepID=A0A284S9A0_ARMOS|nr:uncharacterized protein ARMOST_21132 [Armillaria ostoyae]
MAFRSRERSNWDSRLFPTVRGQYGLGVGAFDSRPDLPELSTESSLTMTTEYSTTTTVVDVEQNLERATVDDPPYLYIDLTTPPSSPSPLPVQEPAVSTECGPACDEHSSLPDFPSSSVGERRVKGPVSTFQPVPGVPRSPSKSTPVKSPCQPVSRPKFTPIQAKFPTPPRPIVHKPVDPIDIKTFQRWPEEDESSSEEEQASTEMEEADTELHQLTASFGSKKLGTRGDAYWVVTHGRIMGVYNDHETMEETNAHFHTAKIHGFPTLKAAQQAWDHMWRNEKIAYCASGLSSANEPDANDNVELFWVVLEGATPGVHRNHADTMAAVGEDNPYLLRIAWNLADAYEIQNWGISHGLIKYHR